VRTLATSVFLSANVRRRSNGDHPRVGAIPAAQIFPTRKVTAISRLTATTHPAPEISMAARPCPVCEKPLSPDAKFCSECGYETRPHHERETPPLGHSTHGRTSPALWDQVRNMPLWVLGIGAVLLLYILIGGWTRILFALVLGIIYRTRGWANPPHSSPTGTSRETEAGTRRLWRRVAPFHDPGGKRRNQGGVPPGRGGCCGFDSSCTEER
jgi:hypothetical protein